MFDVVTFARKEQIITPLASDGTIWKRVAGDGRYDSARLTVQFANGDVRQFRLIDDLADHAWTIRQGDSMLPLYGILSNLMGTFFWTGTSGAIPFICFSIV